MNIPINLPLNKVGVPLVVTTSSPNLCFIVDTGATNNILFSYVLDALNKDYKPLEKAHSIVGINGNPVNVPQIEMSLFFENNKATSIFSVLDASPAISKIQTESGIQIHGILGIPFLTQNEWILYFHNLTITN